MNTPMNELAALSTDMLACIRRALAEDIGAGDVTTDSIVPAEAVMRGQIIAKQAGIIAGLDVACGRLRRGAPADRDAGRGGPGAPRRVR